MTLNFSDNHIRVRLKEKEVQILNTSNELCSNIMENNNIIFSYTIKLFDENIHKIFWKDKNFTLMLPKSYLEKVLIANKKHGIVIENKNSYTLTFQLDIF